MIMEIGYCSSYIIIVMIIIIIASRKLGKGERGQVFPGDIVQFIGNSADGSGASVTYLNSNNNNN